MGLMLSFFSENNAIIIRILAILVAAAAAVLLYRLVFVQTVEPTEQLATVDLTEVTKKVSEQKIEIESLKSESENAKVELEKQRTEVYNLRQTLKEKESELEAVKKDFGASGSANNDAKKLDYEKHKSEVILSTSDESLVFQKEISELKRRLSDYEIIAEDISDMQKLKEENEKLRQQLGAGAGATENSPATGSDEMNMQDVANLVASVSEGLAKSENGAEVEPEVVPSNEDDQRQTLTVETETLEPVSDVDKTLMEKFEKQKET
jgi:chromosome segregation ATPase